MSGLVSISGLATGMDTKSLVSQLMALERQPENLLVKTQTKMQNQIDVYTPLQTALSSLQSLMSGMNTAAKFQVQSSVVSDSSVATATASSTASSGTHELVVNNLVKYQRQLSAKGFSSASDLKFSTGSIIIKGGASDISVDVAEGSNSLNGIAAAINAKAGSNLNASVINDGTGSPYRLVLNGKDTNNYSLDMSGLTTAPAYKGAASPTFTTSADNKTQSSTAFTSASDLQFKTGTFTIGGNVITIDNTNNSLNGIADAINKSGYNLFAKVTNDSSGYKLVLNGTQSIDMAGLATDPVYDNPTFNYAKDSSKQTSSLIAQDFSAAADGNITLNDPTATPTDSTKFDVAIKAGSNLYDIAKAINDSTDPLKISSGLTASVITDGTNSRLVLSKATGINNYTADMSTLTAGVTFSHPDDLTKAPTDDSTYSAALNASFTVDGIPISKNSNTITDAIPGVTLNLLKSGGTSLNPINITVSNDTSSITDKINSFVSSYNEAIGLINKQSVYDTTKKTSGVLFGDSTLRSVKDSLRSLISNKVSGADENYSLLSKIGITSNSKDGTLNVDSALLSTALSTNFSAVTDLFTHNGGVSGLTNNDQYGIAERFNLQLDKLTKAYIGAGGDNGTIATRISGLQKSMTDVDDQVARMELLLTQKEDNLNKQFTAMETLVSGMTTSGNALVSSLSNMPKYA